MENQLISIIIPVYGVEHFIKRCLDSVMKQNYNNLEIIVVDDGSTDASGMICDLLSTTDVRIQIIHKSNGGLSSARNTGMLLATGKYISFIDSDDYIDPQMLKVLYGEVINNQADLAECEWESFSDDSDLLHENNIKYDSKAYDQETAMSFHLKDQLFKQTVWNKLYSKASCSEIDFPEGKINEDEYWTYRVLGKANICVHVNQPYYHYYQRTGSIINSEYSLKRLNGIFAKKERLNYIQEKFPSLIVEARRAYFFSCFYAYQSICRNKDLDRDYYYRNILHQEIKKEYSLELIKDLSFKQKMWSLFFYFAPYLTSKFRNLTKTGL